MNLIKLTLLLLFISLISACSTVPGTGRSQFTPLPDSYMLSMSLTQYGDVIKKSKLSTNTQQVAMVRNVGVKIARAVEELLEEEGVDMKFDWEFNLIEEDVANAWCMPGGKIAVYSGILKFTQDEAGLAVVIGHEVAHALARHGNERMSAKLGIIAVTAAIGVGMKDQDPATRDILLAAVGAGASVGLLLPFSRQHETEADRLGLQLMARAGYNPEAAIPFWTRMAQQEQQSKKAEFLSTHPSNETRIRNIQEFMPEALMYYFPQRHR